MFKFRNLIRIPLVMKQVVRNTQVSVTSNFVRVVTDRTMSPMASVALGLQGGSRSETKANNGVNNLISHMAFKGTKCASRCYVEDLFYLSGATIEIKVRREMLMFVINCDPCLVMEFIVLFAEIVNQLDTCQLETHKLNVFNHLNEIENDPKQVLFDYLHASAFQGSTLGLSPYGTTESYCCITRYDVEEYMKTNYQPYGIVVAAAGAVNHCEIVSCVQANFGCMCTSESCNPCPPYRYTGSMVAYRNDDMPKCHVAIAFETPGFNDIDSYIKLHILKEMVGSWHKNQGGGINFPTYLGQASSVANLCDFYKAFYLSYSDVGLFGIYFLTDSTLIDDMILNAQHLWMTASIASLNYDFQRGKNAAKIRLAKKFIGTNANCQDMVEQIMHRCARYSYSDYCETLHKYNSDAMRNFIYKIFYDRCPVVAALGPTEGVPTYSRIRAGQYSLLL